MSEVAQDLSRDTCKNTPDRYQSLITSENGRGRSGRVEARPPRPFITSTSMYPFTLLRRKFDARRRTARLAGSNICPCRNTQNRTTAAGYRIGTYLDKDPYLNNPQYPFIKALNRSRSGNTGRRTLQELGFGQSCKANEVTA